MKIEHATRRAESKLACRVVGQQKSIEAAVMKKLNKFAATVGLQVA
jgi:hypothetical protein